VPSEEAVEHLDEFLAVRREAGPFRWTAAEQLHVTLAFCADVADHDLDGFVERLASAAGRRTPVTTRIAGGGAFPDPARAKVLWAGLDLDAAGDEEVARMASGARTAASTAGIVVDGQRFRPHVTVARLGRAQQASRWVQLLDGYRGPTWVAYRWDLVASHLGEGPRRRPRHEVVASLTVG
jgi:2'-5' RNA ligase